MKFLSLTLYVSCELVTESRSVAVTENSRHNTHSIETRPLQLCSFHLVSFPTGIVNCFSLAMSFYKLCTVYLLSLTLYDVSALGDGFCNALHYVL